MQNQKYCAKRNFFSQNMLLQRNWVFATNPNFLLPICLQPNYLNLRYFKLWFFHITEVKVWNIWGLQHWVVIRYRDLKIRVCDKDSIPLPKFTISAQNQTNEGLFKNYDYAAPKSQLVTFSYKIFKLRDDKKFENWKLMHYSC